MEGSTGKTFRQPVTHVSESSNRPFHCGPWILALSLSGDFATSPAFVVTCAPTICGSNSVGSLACHSLFLNHREIQYRKSWSACVSQSFPSHPPRHDSLHHRPGSPLTTHGLARPIAARASVAPPKPRFLFRRHQKRSRHPGNPDCALKLACCCCRM